MKTKRCRLAGWPAAVLVIALAACSPAPSSSASPVVSVPAPQSAAASSVSASSSTLPTPTLTPGPVSYDGAPPPSIQAWLSGQARIGFRPLTAGELAAVRVTRAEAVRAAMSVPGPGYGPANDHFTWTKTGCVYLGVYTAPQMPSLGYVPPVFAAYLVQVIAKPAKNFAWENVEIGVVDAVSGEATPFYGNGGGPILGTTCGVTP